MTSVNTLSAKSSNISIRQAFRTRLEEVSAQLGEQKVKPAQSDVQAWVSAAFADRATLSQETHSRVGHDHAADQPLQPMNAEVINNLWRAIPIPQPPLTKVNSVR